MKLEGIRGVEKTPTLLLSGFVSALRRPRPIIEAVADTKNRSSTLSEWYSLPQGRG
jgi:hypothetical protein